VHVPGGWWGGLEALYASAIAVDEDRSVLIEALKDYRAQEEPP